MKGLWTGEGERGKWTANIKKEVITGEGWCARGRQGKVDS